jgi:hypothetical protein
VIGSMLVVRDHTLGEGPGGRERFETAIITV